ncbi:hypothetical protein [Methylobacterium longum]|uniref:Uncharacterized protein n=1 Tax=Methylobacterium longum TaxID=767694 RepID=A0ABT8AU62_9HYPH|nr:hypothetical protein [Methylobacterium longum]MDN3572960.1 hypothetical protein [Methylobacterium longum]GJE14557.1 hypothetical protein FOHLNKBM_5632 [Methylobacterium longum]
MAGKAEKTNGGGRTEEHGGFFAVHRGMWNIVSQQATMNEAVAYLVLARGSHFGTRLTSWSADSIERYTAIGRGRVKEAIAGLVAAGLIVQTRVGTRPQYYLPTAPEFERMYAPDVELTLAQRALFDRVRRSKGPIPLTADDTELAEDLELRGLLMGTEDGGYFVDPDIDHIPRSAWIWLPNSLVGEVDGPPGPLDQIRQTQDKLALGLLVDLYYWQSLASNGGLHWLMIRQEYDRVRLGQRGIHDIWGFRRSGVMMSNAAPFVEPYLTGEYVTAKEPDGTTSEADTGSAKVWATVVKLNNLGLIQFVPHLIEADTKEGEVIHPCPISVGVPEEQAITAAARDAALRLMTDGQERFADSKGYEPIIPLPRHLDNAVLVGLLRLTYRAHTTATAKWMTNAEDWARWVAKYNQIGVDA